MSSEATLITLSNPFDIENAFATALKRLNVGQAKVSVNGSNYPLDAVTHQNVFLPKIALRAEELSVLIFGVRLFPGVTYIIQKKSPSGFQIQNISDLNDDQLQDPNVLITMSIATADRDTLTSALQGLLLELSIAECFDVDLENNLLISKDLDMEVHKTFKLTEEYLDGQCIPLLPAEYLIANELQILVHQEAPLKALNKARRIADDLAVQRQARKANELNDDMERNA